jgi:hypothetical protein
VLHFSGVHFSGDALGKEARVDITVDFEGKVKFDFIQHRYE